jgi:hypothetical protein
MADEQFPLEQFLGGKIASQTQAVAGMKAAEEEQARQLDAAKDTQAAVSEAVAPLKKSLAEQLGAGLEETTARFHQLAQDSAPQELAVPDLPDEEQRIFPGSVGLVRVRPYDYQWTWSNQSAGAKVSVGADKGTGQLSFALDTHPNQANAACMNGLGAFYRPIYNGYLHAVAIPLFNYSWLTSCAGSACHSDGWLGLYVGRYNLAGAFDRAVVSYQLLQWKSDEWFLHSGTVRGSNPGYPLTAYFPVDTAHWYAIWVWSGGSVWATDNWAGGFFAEGSSANSNLNLGVPLISMALI